MCTYIFYFGAELNNFTVFLSVVHIPDVSSSDNLVLNGTVGQPSHMIVFWPRLKNLLNTSQKLNYLYQLMQKNSLIYKNIYLLK